MVKRILIGITGGILLLVGYLLVLYTQDVDLGERTVTVIVNEGDSFARIAARLIDEQVVRSRLMLVLPARLRDIDKTLTPGRYDFAGKNSCRSVLRRLAEADYLRVRITLPEGLPIWRIAGILQSRLDLDSARIVSYNSDSAFLKPLGIPTLEGYLFPETYTFKWGISDTVVIATMVDMFHTKTGELLSGLSDRQRLSREEIITLASIVEAEAYLSHEKPLVASVYLNRLRENWRLDADPTVIYGLGGLSRPLMRGDLRQPTPYNTYRMRGLPPTPINSPGLDAIRAVLEPADTDYFFFVADGSGGHYFSRTNDEHNRARGLIRRGLRP
jgi:UPF0755 protein